MSGNLFSVGCVPADPNTWIGVLGLVEHSLTGLSYVAIAALLRVAVNLGAIPLRRSISITFATFILACGMHHLSIPLCSLTGLSWPMHTADMFMTIVSVTAAVQLAFLIYQFTEHRGGFKTIWIAFRGGRK